MVMAQNKQYVHKNFKKVFFYFGIIKSTLKVCVNHFKAFRLYFYHIGNLNNVLKFHDILFVLRHIVVLQQQHFYFIKTFF